MDEPSQRRRGCRTGGITAALVACGLMAGSCIQTSEVSAVTAACGVNSVAEPIAADTQLNQAIEDHMRETGFVRGQADLTPVVVENLPPGMDQPEAMALLTASGFSYGNRQCDPDEPCEIWFYREDHSCVTTRDYRIALVFEQGAVLEGKGTAFLQGL